MNYAIPDYVIKQKIDKIFKTLFDKELLDTSWEDDDKFHKIWRRTNSIMKISEAKYIILLNDDLLKKYKNFWAGHFIEEFDIYNDFFQQAASYLLSMYEHIKRFLLLILDKKKLSLKNKSTYGGIITKIAQNCSYDEKELLELFDVSTRNIIGHDDWYYSDKNFTYEDSNGNEKKITIEEFVKRIYHVTSLSSAVSVSWFQYVLPLLSNKSGRSKNY